MLKYMRNAYTLKIVYRNEIYTINYKIWMYN